MDVKSHLKFSTCLLDTCIIHYHQPSILALEYRNKLHEKSWKKFPVCDGLAACSGCLPVVTQCMLGEAPTIFNDVPVSLVILTSLHQPPLAISLRGIHLKCCSISLITQVMPLSLTF